MAKSAQALGCSRCGSWVHIGCGDLDENDYALMRSRERRGFRWFCSQCIAREDLSSEAVTTSEMEARILNSVVSTMAEFQREMFVRLSSLEKKIVATEGAVLDPICETKKFADIVKEALHKSRNDQEQGSKSGIKVKSFGKSKTIQNHQVLVVKPKSGTVTNETRTAAATNIIKGALGSIPVNSCRETKMGAIVVKFPTNEAKKEARNAMNACFNGGSDFTVSEPKKMMPKITLVGIPISRRDDEILNEIIHKNKEIDELKEKGCTLELLLTKREIVNMLCLRCLPKYVP